MTRIGFIACTEMRGLTVDDRLAAEALSTRGFQVLPVAWDEPTLALVRLDAWVFRSCWNYHHKSAEFERWVSNREGQQVFNSPTTVRWSMNKKYLLELQHGGLDLPITNFFEAGSNVDFEGLTSGISSACVVIKPAVSLNGFDTFRFRLDDPNGIVASARRILTNRDLLVQEYLPEIETQGETSLIFFEGNFSHALRKTPRSGEFRIQESHGGTIVPTEANSELIKRARGHRTFALF